MTSNGANPVAVIVDGYSSANFLPAAFRRRGFELISVSDLETIEETLDLLSTPGAVDEIRTAEAEIARGEAIGADELRRLMAERVRNERNAG
jgi:hypothetical protein